MIKKIWDNNDSKLPLVLENASWRLINDFADFQSCTGVFIFANASHKVLFVGKTQNNCIIEAISESIEDGNGTKAKLIKVLYTQIDKDAKFISDILIEKYSPENNKLKSDIKIHQKKTK